MSFEPKSRMDVDAFLAWAEGRDGKYELVDGAVVAMSPQTARHVRAKARVFGALQRAVTAAGLDCEVLADGMTVRIDAATAFEPDALIQCGEAVADDAIEAPNPILVVEVLSPGTRKINTGRKLEGYLRPSSVMHYLIVDPERPMVIHHRRGEAGEIATRIASAGLLRIDPPGMSLDVSDLFGEVRP